MAVVGHLVVGYELELFKSSGSAVRGLNCIEKRNQKIASDKFQFTKSLGSNYASHPKNVQDLRLSPFGTVLLYMKHSLG